VQQEATTITAHKLIQIILFNSSNCSSSIKATNLLPRIISMRRQTFQIKVARTR